MIVSLGEVPTKSDLFSLFLIHLGLFNVVKEIQILESKDFYLVPFPLCLS